MLKVSKIICVIAACFASSAALASDTHWTISDADGQVTVTRDSKPIYGAEGTVLKAGDTVTTSKTARAVLVRGEQFVVVTPSKKVRITRPKDKGTVTKVFEYLGGMVSGASPKSSFNAGTSAAVVKGLGGGLEKSGSARGSGAAAQDNPDAWKEITPQSRTEAKAAAS